MAPSSTVRGKTRPPTSISQAAQPKIRKSSSILNLRSHLRRRTTERGKRPLEAHGPESNRSPGSTRPMKKYRQVSPSIAEEWQETCHTKGERWIWSIMTMIQTKAKSGQENKNSTKMAQPMPRRTKRIRVQTVLHLTWSS